MSFDKSKAMRNAERYVAQGKIRAAISEYRAVVDNDPRDIATLNMLGDLYAKSAEKRDAVNCYLQVADHYNNQGFAQKAIAVYNKITRIQPDSIEVSAKLAELHKVKGSLSEARSHYMTLAEHYESNGHPLEALSMYKQIALLDPNNTEVCLNLAEAYIREGQRDEAVEAYAEAGARFSRQNKQEEAIRALTKGFDIKSTDLRILNGLIKAQTALGRAGKAASLLDEILENDPYNRDVLYLLIECCIDSQNAGGAEKAIVKLVEIEPANYSKFLDLVRIYLNSNDPASAARVLTMSAEYLLAGGQAEECGKWINEILERDPGQLSGLRLLVRYHSWMNDPGGFGSALERLFAAAAEQKSIDDQRIALSQLVIIKPQETRYHDRLKEINEEYGYGDESVDEEKLRSEFGILPADALAEHTDNFEGSGDDEMVEPDKGASLAVERNGHVVEASIVQEPSGHETNGHSHAAEQKIQKELESIAFYIENDYHELAEKAIAELRREFGDRPEFNILSASGASVPESTPIAPVVNANPIGIDEMRSEFGLQGTEAEAEEEDYETHYQMAVAYQEMGLMEEAIREFQDAISLTEPADGSRRFFHCGYLLGHCFLESGKPHHAITWITRALETPGITDEEYHGLWYDLGLAHEANGEEATAAAYFEKIYADNVDFRDVGERIKNVVPSVRA